jgi:uroporphyrinogen-III decarboxylase
MGLINEGLVPLVFAEAVYDARLETISDLPKGRVIWWFEKTDMPRAKEILGETCCIMGNVSNALLSIGTPGKVESCCKELIEGVGKGGGFILSTAAGMQGAKPENVKAMIDSVKKFCVRNG